MKKVYMCVWNELNCQLVDMPHNNYLFNYAELEILLVLRDGGVALLVLIAVVHDGFTGHALLSSGDSRHFPHRSGGPMPNIPSFHGL